MILQDAIKLIDHPDLYATSPTMWADFGSGTGLFTKALATLLMPGSKIYAIDQKADAFKTDAIVNDVSFEKITTDFTAALSISDLDGIMMANSLHFVSDKVDFLKKCSK